jgi:hypothetical protein
MSKELDSRSKTALDETRLLLMGAMLLDLNPKRFSRELLMLSVPAARAAYYDRRHCAMGSSQQTRVKFLTSVNNAGRKDSVLRMSRTRQAYG